MAVTISTIIISVLALLTTFYQARLQRVHNEKTVKPLGQITLTDRGKVFSVHLRNNGLGPLIVDRLGFNKDGRVYSSIKDCLDLDPKSYMHVSMDDLAERVVLPNAHLPVFEKNVGNNTEAEINSIRMQLTYLALRVEGRDIYDNKITFARDFKWFSRHCQLEINETNC